MAPARSTRGRRPSRRRRPQTKVELYHSETRKLMHHVTGRTYLPGHKWSKPDLKRVTPDKIVVYLK